MHTLYNFLLTQHSKQLNPVRCRETTISQLHRYLEDVVIENNLPALVIEYLPTSEQRSTREIGRLKNLDRTSRNFFLMLTRQDAFSKLLTVEGAEFGKIQVLDRIDNPQ